MSHKRKVLLMGKDGSGKTSMRSIIFANYAATDTRRLGATIDVEHCHVRFLGNLLLSIWDCGGQDAFMENYFSTQRDIIFRNVEVFIYVFDVESREIDRDMRSYHACLRALVDYSPDARVFCLVHKMDLIREDSREEMFLMRENRLKKSSDPFNVVCFRTSIWDETLYKAWSSIVYQLIPNVSVLEFYLKQFAEVIEANETMLFERSTFLVVSYYQRKSHTDLHRFERISNILKQFKLSCSKIATQFQSIQTKNSLFVAFICTFTENTYCMVISSDLSITPAAMEWNILNARQYFSHIDKRTRETQKAAHVPSLYS